MANEIVDIDAVNPEPGIIQQAADLIAGGKVIVCPTDTGYALSANALDPQAVMRVFNLKGRVYSNPIHVAVSSIEMAEKYAVISPAADKLAREFLPGALTLVLPRREIVPALLVAGRDTIGIRIPNNKVILRLAALTGVPLTATSANVSGQPAPYSVAEIIGQLGESAGDVVLFLDQGPLPTPELSTIIDLTVDPPRLLRPGKISREEIRRVLPVLLG